MPGSARAQRAPLGPSPVLLTLPSGWLWAWEEEPWLQLCLLKRLQEDLLNPISETTPVPTSLPCSWGYLCLQWHRGRAMAGGIPPVLFSTSRKNSLTPLSPQQVSELGQQPLVGAAPGAQFCHCAGGVRAGCRQHPWVHSSSKSQIPAGAVMPAEGPQRWHDQGCVSVLCSWGCGQSKGAVKPPRRCSIPHNAIMYCWY